MLSTSTPAAPLFAHPVPDTAPSAETAAAVEGIAQAAETIAETARQSAQDAPGGTILVRTIPTPGIPSNGPLAALLSQTALELGRLEEQARQDREARAKAEKERDDARAALTATVAAASARPAPSTDVHPDDARHVPAAIPAWTPMPIEPAAEWCARNGIALALVGPPGCGKSDLPKQIAARLGRPYVRISCSDGATEGRIIGRRDVKEGATTWTDGPLPRAMERGYFLTLDELGAAPAGVLACAHDALASGTLHIPERGDTIAAAPGCWITATSNYLGSDRADVTHEQPISAALADRFVVFSVEFMAPAREAQLMLRRCGVGTPPDAEKPADLKPWTSANPTDLAARIAELLNDLRASEKAGDLSGPYSRRRGFDFLRLLLAWGKDEAGRTLAARGALIDRHPPSQREAVAELIFKRLGIKKP